MCNMFYPLRGRLLRLRASLGGEYPCPELSTDDLGSASGRAFDRKNPRHLKTQRIAAARRIKVTLSKIFMY